MKRLHYTNGLQKKNCLPEKPNWNGGGVCESEKERERETKKRNIFLPSLYASSQILPQYSQT